MNDEDIDDPLAGLEDFDVPEPLGPGLAFALGVTAAVVLALIFCAGWGLVQWLVAGTRAAG